MPVRVARRWFVKTPSKLSPRSRWSRPRGSTGEISSRTLGIGLGLALLIFGGALGALFFPQIIKWRQATNWEPVPAQIISSEVLSNHSSDGDTYKVEILYEYERGGRHYRSNRYDFSIGYSSGYRSKQAVVKAHPPGRSTTAYVDPADPTQAVINRGTPWLAIALGLLAALLLVGSAYCFFHRPRPQKAQTADGTSAAAELTDRLMSRLDPQPQADGRLVLEPKYKPSYKVIGALFAALFWNGIISVFIFEVVASFQSGSPNWFLAIFLIPFVVVGLVLIGSVFYFILALKNPRPLLELDRHRLHLGDTARFSWKLQGRVEKLSKLRFYLRGSEKATYRRGTNTSTDTHHFFEQDVAETQGVFAFAAGEGTFTLPADTMPSFKSTNNEIVWELVIHGEIPRWPDIHEEFTLRVLAQESYHK